MSRVWGSSTEVEVKVALTFSRALNFRFVEDCRGVSSSRTKNGVSKEDREDRGRHK